MSLLDPPNLRARIEQIVLEILKDNNFTDPQSSDVNVLKAQLFEAKHQLTLAINQRGNAEAEAKRQRDKADEAVQQNVDHLTFFSKLQDLINEHNAKLNP